MKALKITAIALGTRGDVQPIVELLQELKRRGHDVQIAVQEKFRPLAEEMGIPRKPIGGSADNLLKRLVTDYKTGVDFLFGCIALYKENPNLMEEMDEAIAGSDFVIYTFLAGFAHHICEKRNIPCARVFYSPFDKTEQYSLYDKRHNLPAVAKSYDTSLKGLNLLTKLLANRWRRQNGLSPWTMKSDYRMLNGKRVLTFYPTSPYLMSPDKAWGDATFVTGYFYHPDEDAAGYEADEKLLSFLNAGDTKPLFVGFGKASSDELKELQRRVLTALKETKIRAVVQSEIVQGETDKNLYVLPSDVPYAWLFPRVHGVVHHGGNTTNGLGLLYGNPTLVIALALDQYYYGRTVFERGVGVEPLYIRKRLCTVDEIKERLLQLTSGKFDAAALRLSEILRRETGCETAADAIEASYERSFE